MPSRHANPDIRRAFIEFQDPDSPAKCAKVRCQHCGYVRAKNTTRQIEHLQECQAFLSSAEGQQSMSAAPTQDGDDSATRAMLNGTHPNPNLQVHRRGPNQNKRNRDGQPILPNLSHQQAHQPMPSLTGYLLSVNKDAFTAATQQPFLSHAGCGTLAAPPLIQWLVQDAHFARGYVQFIGQLLAKIRLPSVHNSQFHPLYRTMDLLISALNNVRREMSFFEITATKYGLQLTDESPNFITRGYLDLFISSSSASASLLEGMVLLWATEHNYRTSWLYASSFTQNSHGGMPAFGAAFNAHESPHIAALHQSLIPNWTSPAFSKFVDACRGLVDELANSMNSPNGKEEMSRCDQVFKQVCWLGERFWPDVDGMGEEDENGRLGSTGLGAVGMGNGSNDSSGFGGVLNGVAEAAAGGASS